jgi:hypothetical protein
VSEKTVINPFRPGAGHVPLYLAGRDAEKKEFQKLLQQQIILNNLILTGLRGVGKTVLLEELRPIATNNDWVWVGTDLSEATCINEEAVAIRLITDLSIFTSSITVSQQPKNVGFSLEIKEEKLNYFALLALYHNAPGLVSDKLKLLLQYVWVSTKGSGIKGIVFAYDEAQTMSDNARKEQYPLSLLLDVFQSIQKSNIPFMLVLVGLPTLFPKLVDTRTYSERMFDVLTLGKLSAKDCKDAIVKPIQQSKSAVSITEDTIDLIITTSGGYPFFIQFICKEIFDIFVQQIRASRQPRPVPMHEIVKKLDKDFFAGRWARVTDRQRELLGVISKLEKCDEEFSANEIAVKSTETAHPFSASHVNQMLVALSNAGLIYKNRYGKYAFAVPLMGQFIRRQDEDLKQLELPGL